MAIWDIIFTTPEDETWHLVSNGHRFGLHHECLKGKVENPMVQVEKCCTYCPKLVPEGILGAWKLHNYDNHAEALRIRSRAGI